VDEPLREVAPLAKPYLRHTSGVKKIEKEERERESGMCSEPCEISSSVVLFLAVGGAPH